MVKLKTTKEKACVEIKIEGDPVEVAKVLVDATICIIQQAINRETKESKNRLKKRILAYMESKWKVRECINISAKSADAV